MKKLEKENNIASSKLQEVTASGGSVESKPQQKKQFPFGDVLFYGTLLAVVLTVYLTAGTGDGAPRNVFGYSIFSVLTTSMESEIPKGSLVVTKKVDQKTIQVGDDITFLRKDETTVTHRVIAIYEDYQGSGMCGFQTKGVDNSMPDEEIVLATNVIGVVIGHVSLLGDWIAAITSHLWLVLIFMALLIATGFCLRIYFSERRKERL